MFIDTDMFPFAKEIASEWKVMRDEFLELPGARHLPWHQHDLYSGDWDVFGLYHQGDQFTENCKAVPETTRLVESVVGLRTAGFSILRPDTFIKPHVGYGDGVYRMHLGLITPPEKLRCCLQIGDQVSPWRDGGVTIFDDTSEHQAWNYSNVDRVILLLDFAK